MAVVPRDLPITREMVYQWLQDWKATPQPKPTRKQYFKDQIDALNLEDPYVDVSERDDIPAHRIHIKDLLEMDIGSYK